MEHKTYRSIRYKPTPSPYRIEGIREERIIYNATIIYSDRKRYMAVHNYNNNDNDILEYLYFVPDNKLNEFVHYVGFGRSYRFVDRIDTQISKNVFSRKYHTRNSWVRETNINKDSIIAIED